MSSDMIFCGTARIVEFDNGGSIMKLSLRSEDLDTLLAHVENGWVNAEVCKRKEPSAKGQTHYVKIDTWKPKAASQQASGPARVQGDAEVDDDGAPF